MTHVSVMTHVSDITHVSDMTNVSDMTHVSDWFTNHHVDMSLVSLVIASLSFAARSTNTIAFFTVNHCKLSRALSFY